LDNFETLTDITRSLQHKQEQVVKLQRKHALLVDLNALPSPESPKSQFDQEAFMKGININPLDEPNPTLPLWRRVDKRFWWNEWLLKPFIDAGVIAISKLYRVISSMMTSCTPTFFQ